MSTPRYFTQTLKLLTNYRGPPPDHLPAIARRQILDLRKIVASPDVVGLGVGKKEVAGEPLGQLALVFYVKRKHDRSDLGGQALIPPVIAAPNGRAIYTDVIEIGEVKPQATRSPIASGNSIAHVRSNAGTLGAIVTRNGQRMVLGNAHVLAAEGTGSFGDAILYPAPSDGGTDPNDRIATLAGFKRFKSGGDYVNRVDAALGLLLDTVSGRLSDTVPGARRPFEVVDPVRDMNVMLTGRSSGTAHSRVYDINAAVQVNYDQVGLIGFAAQTLCRPGYTEAGDSGALVLDSDTGSIVGLHFAASAQGSYFTPIRTVMSALGFAFSN